MIGIEAKVSIKTKILDIKLIKIKRIEKPIKEKIHLISAIIIIIHINDITIMIIRIIKRNIIQIINLAKTMKEMIETIIEILEVIETSIEMKEKNSLIITIKLTTPTEIIKEIDRIQIEIIIKLIDRIIMREIEIIMKESIMTEKEIEILSIGIVPCLGTETGIEIVIKITFMYKKAQIRRTNNKKITVIKIPADIFLNKLKKSFILPKIQHNQKNRP